MIEKSDTLLALWGGQQVETSELLQLFWNEILEMQECDAHRVEVFKEAIARLHRLEAAGRYMSLHYPHEWEMALMEAEKRG